MNVTLSRRQEKSNSKHSLPDLRSALQKYVRRNELIKGLKVVVEIDVMGFFESNDLCARRQATIEKCSTETVTKNSKCIRSCLMNRMICIMSEEVSICNYLLPIEIKKIYMHWSELREKNVNNSNDLEMLCCLLNIYKMLIFSPKCRLLSDLKTVYHLPPYYFTNDAQDNACYAKLVETEFAEQQKFVMSRQNQIDDNTDLVAVMKTALQEMNEQDYFLALSNALSRAGRGMQLLKKKVWELLMQYSLDSERFQVIQSLKFFFTKMTHKDYWLYLYHASLVVLKRDRLHPIQIDNNMITMFEARSVVFETLRPDSPIILDDYIYDYHATGICGRGDKINFALIGAALAVEDTTFKNNEYRRLYIANKYIIEDFIFNIYDNVDADQTRIITRKRPLELSLAQVPHKKVVKHMDIDAKLFMSQYVVMCIDTNEAERIDLLPKAQLLTSSFKKYVHIDEEFVYKGPYQYNDRKLLRNLQCATALEYLEEQLIGVSHSYFSHILQHEDQYYIAARRIGHEYKDTDFIPCYKGGKQINILKRGSFCKRMCDLQPKEISSTIADEVVQHLYLRFLLNIGDSGPHNILYSASSGTGFNVIGVDFDEYAMNNLKLSRAECLFKRGADDYAEALITMKKFDKIFTGTACLPFAVSGIDVDDLNMRIEFFNNLFV
jgi:hypothetical protein